MSTLGIATPSGPAMSHTSSPYPTFGLCGVTRTVSTFSFQFALDLPFSGTSIFQRFAPIQPFFRSPIAIQFTSCDGKPEATSRRGCQQRNNFYCDRRAVRIYFDGYNSLENWSEGQKKSTRLGRLCHCNCHDTLVGASCLQRPSISRRRWAPYVLPGPV